MADSAAASCRILKEGGEQMASITRRKDRYCVVYLYDDENGKRKQKWETFKTLDEAKRRKAEIEYPSF